MKIKKGDHVIVIAGKSKGKTGKVLAAFPKENKILVDGVNVLVKHQKAARSGEKGRVAEKHLPIHVSNVMIQEDGKRTRVGRKLVGEKSIRVSKKTGKEL